MNGIALRIKGKVQGVGFRPFVWLLANKYQLKGDVNNDGQGVLIRFCEPDENNLSRFLSELKNNLPPLAEITEIYQNSIILPDAEYSEFIIRESENNKMDTQIIPDAATCSHCLQDLFDPQNRRFHYPFTNCTHCGPRFTIIKAIPYDRKNTSMASFPFCSHCEAEYKNPADRRFHAQPNACADCGPHIWLSNQQGLIATHEKALKQTALLLQQGKIVAIKGIGGFHLACDARNESAVNLLRQRKHRPTKPFAIMVKNVDMLQAITPEERQQLCSSATPIVLLSKSKVPQICDQIAPHLAEIGVMLPSNPLQHLLLAQVAAPLVMTSANACGQPPVLTNEQALLDLADLADAYLCHNRDILQRADDSLVRVAFDGLETLRRARGYVPDETLLEQQSTQQILALGSDLKNTFCLLRQNKAVVSQHIGDTANERVQQQLIDNIGLFQQIYQFKPDMIAIDAHPGYFSSQVGKNFATQFNLPYQEIIHHHAHIVSVMAEHHCQAPVIGLALDGIGMGEKNQLWGGECLLVDQQQYQHIGGLPTVALPGGDLAAKQPWRNWLAHLQQFVPNWQSIAEHKLAEYPWQSLSKAIEKGINSPIISSTGRLFDAVAYSLGIAPAQQSWEGEAACQLEALARQSQFAPHLVAGSNTKSAVDFAVKIPLLSQQDKTYLDLATFWQTWLSPENQMMNSADKALVFHYALAQSFAQLARQAAITHHCQNIVLSGGVMHNVLLRYFLKDNLREFNVLSAHKFPMGDGGLSLGQAVIAMARQQKSP